MKITDLSGGVLDNTAAFDQEIAPMIKALAIKLEGLGVPFMLSIEYAKGMGASSYFLPPNCSESLRAALLIVNPAVFETSTNESD